MTSLNLENTDKDQLKEGPSPDLPQQLDFAESVRVTPSVVDQVLPEVAAMDTSKLNQTPSTTSSSSSLPLSTTASLPILTTTSTIATVFTTNRPGTSSFSPKITAATPAELLKMVEKAQRMKHILELRKGLPNDDNIKQRISAAELLEKSAPKVVEVVADLPRQGKDGFHQPEAGTAKHLEEVKGKPMKLGEQGAMGVESKTRGDLNRLEMFRIAGDASNTVIFLDLSSVAGKSSLEHSTLTLGGGRVLVKVILLSSCEIFFCRSC